MSIKLRIGHIYIYKSIPSTYYGCSKGVKLTMLFYGMKIKRYSIKKLIFIIYMYVYIFRDVTE